MFLPVMQDTPGIRDKETGDSFKDDGLPRTGRAHDTVIISFPDGERDIIEQEVPERYRYPVKLYHRTSPDTL